MWRLTTTCLLFFLFFLLYTLFSPSPPPPPPRSSPICPEILRLSALPGPSVKTVRGFLKCPFPCEYKQSWQSKYASLYQPSFFLFAVFHWQATIMGPVSIKLLWTLLLYRNIKSGLLIHNRQLIIFYEAFLFWNVTSVHQEGDAAHSQTQRQGGQSGFLRNEAKNIRETSLRDRSIIIPGKAHIIRFRCHILKLQNNKARSSSHSRSYL